MDLERLIQQIARLLKARKLTISVCESCTGGMLGAALTRVSGSSEYFLGGIIAYADAVKKKVVGVKARVLGRYGAVSAESACEMARGVQQRLQSDISVAVTGIAGPTGGSVEKPIGTVFIAIARDKGVRVRRFRFKGTRERIRRSACLRALELLKQELRNA
ncbi:MAG: CinA family protein [candidate division WOR-3 bacterium]|jgi:nicotinamide-nucleotide amidase